MEKSIIMPGNVEVSKFGGEEYDLSAMTQSQILTLIVQYAPEVPVGSELVIKNTYSSWIVSLKKITNMCDTMMEIGQNTSMIDLSSGRHWEGTITKLIRDKGDYSYRNAHRAIIKEINGDLECEVSESNLWWNAEKGRWYQPV